MVTNGPGLPLWATIVLLGAIALLLLLWWRATTRARRATRARQRRARRGEDLAEDLLAEAGFTVVDRQVTVRWTLLVDGEAVEVGCRADLVVDGPDGRFVAEVKTGDRAPDPTFPATRRQLLEYLHAFGDQVDGVLLVDMERGEVRRVERYEAPGYTRTASPSSSTARSISGTEHTAASRASRRPSRGSA
jgi:hypothetical protein